MNEAEFLEERLQLSSPIEEKFWELLKVGQVESDANCRAYKVIIPLVHRFICKYAWQLERVMEDEKENIDHCLVSRIPDAINVVFMLPEESRKVCGAMTECVFKRAGEMVKAESYGVQKVELKRFGDTIFTQCHQILIPLFEMSDDYACVVQIVVDYFVARCDCLDSVGEIQLLVNALGSVSRIPNVLLVAEGNVIIRNIFHACAVFMKTIFERHNIGERTGSVFALGCEMLRIFGVWSRKDWGFTVSEYGSIDLTVAFISWCGSEFSTYEENVSGFLAREQNVDFVVPTEEGNNGDIRFVVGRTFGAPVKITCGQCAENGTGCRDKYSLDGDVNAPFQVNELNALFEACLVLLNDSADMTFVLGIFQAMFLMVVNIVENGSDVIMAHFLQRMATEVLNRSEMRVTEMVLTQEADVWSFILHPFFFKSGVCSVTDKEKYVDLVLDVRQSVCRLALRFFTFSVESSNDAVHDSATMMIKRLCGLMSSMDIQVFCDMLPLIIRLFRVSPANFVLTIKDNGMMELIGVQMIGLQRIHINADGVENQSRIEELRITVFEFLDEFLSSDTAIYYWFSKHNCVHTVISLTFEDNVCRYAVDIMKRGLTLRVETPGEKANNQLKIIVEQLVAVLKSALANFGQEDWVKFICVILELVRDAIEANKRAVMPVLMSEALLMISRIPSAVIRANPGKFCLVSTEISKDENYDNICYKVIQCTLNVFVPIVHSQGPGEYHKLVSLKHEHSQNLVRALSLIRFDDRFVNILFALVFESHVKLSDNAPTATIRNYFALPLLFHATKHLSSNARVLECLVSVCSDSISNKLKLFQAGVPDILLDFVEHFPLENGNYEDSLLALNKSLELFSTVLRYAFSMPTLFHSIKAMRRHENGMRSWWTAQLLSFFSSCLEGGAPTAFFCFDGKDTGVKLPHIPRDLISKGWSFVCRFELDSSPKTHMRLLRVGYENGSVLSVGFRDEILEIEYSSTVTDKCWAICFDKMKLARNQWCTLIFSSDYHVHFGSHEEGLFSVKMEKKTNLRRTFKFVSVHNASDDLDASKESRIITNIGYIYLFTGTMSDKDAKLFWSLPLNFVFNFSPSERQLDPKLPGGLFNGEVESKLLFGTNARMTDKEICFNISKSGQLGNGEFHGSAYPFSTSFIDIAGGAGGVKLFLPLFDQVDLEGYPAELCDSGDFFLGRIFYIFGLLFARSESLVTDFLRVDGFKAMSYAMLQIKPFNYSSTVFVSLSSLWRSLDLRVDSTIIEYRRAMLSDIWLNFGIWKRLSKANQLVVYETSLPLVYNTDPDLFHSLLSLEDLCYVIQMQPEETLRASLWKLLRMMANVKWSEEGQNALLVYGMAGADLRFRRDALECVLDLCSRSTAGGQALLKRHNGFMPILQLLREEDEGIRVIALKLLFVAKELIDSATDEDFDAVIATAIRQINYQGTTSSTWDLLISYAFEKNVIVPRMRFVFPLLCAISHCFNLADAVDMVSGIQTSVSADRQSCAYVTNCRAWYLWSLYLLLQMSQDTMNVGTAHPVITMIGDLCAHMACNNGLAEPLSFFMSLTVTQGWRSSLIMHNILIPMLGSHVYNGSPVAVQAITYEVVWFLFFVMDCEMFKENLELYDKYALTHDDSLSNHIEARLHIHEFMKMKFMGPSAPQFSMNMRCLPNGIWANQSVAIEWLIYIVKEKERNPEIVSMQIQKLQKHKVSASVSDIVAFVAANILALAPESKVSSLVFARFRSFFSGRSADVTQAAMLLWGCTRAVRVKPGLCETMTTYLSSEASLVAPFKALSVSVDFHDATCRAKIAETGSYFVTWLEQMKSFASSAGGAFTTRCSLFEHTFSNVEATFNKPLLSLNYNEEVGELDSAVHRRQMRDRSLAGKSHRRIMREMKSNGGPWCDDVEAMHWRLAPRTDAHFRRMFMRPNNKFSSHKEASYKRDQSKTARLDYLRWIEEQKEETMSVTEDIVDLDSDEPFRRDSHIQVDASLVAIAAVYTGSFYLSKTDISFDGVRATDDPGTMIEGRMSKTVQIGLGELKWVFHRSYLHIDKGLEFFARDGRSYFFFFPKDDRRQILSFLSGLKLTNNVTIQRSPSARFLNELRLTEKWQARQITTYDYLIMVNLIAGRSFNDLSQYPVFPWIIADYTSETLDLENPATFRDLASPIGALEPARLARLKEDVRDAGGDCLYRCHYSTAYYVLHYMMRMEPFTTMHIAMQAGKFDHPNRLFRSIEKSWESVVSLGNDFRELIPEFFTLSEFLVNRDNFDLGLDDSNVTLPAWATSPADFIHKHRQALESDYVGEHIGSWIDLVFGVKQTGPLMWENNNAFHPYCYTSSITSEVLADPELLHQIQCHACSFGITPRKLFAHQHPSRTRAPRQTRTLDFRRIHMKLSGSVLYMACSGNCIYAITDDMCLHRMRSSPGGTAQTMSFGVDVGKTIVRMPTSNMFVVTSPSEDMFQAFAIDSGLSHIVSVRVQFSVLESLASGGGSILVVLSQDGCLEVWDFQSQTSHELICKVNHHHVRTIGVAANESLQMIASCDVNRKVVMCELYRGSFIRSFTLIDSGYVPVKVMLVNEGYFIAVAERRLRGGEVHSIIQSYDLMGEVSSSPFGLPKRITAICPVNRQFGGSMIAAGFENGCFVLFHVPSGEEAHKVQCDSPVTAISYDESSDTLYLCKTNVILSLHLGNA